MCFLTISLCACNDLTFFSNNGKLIPLFPIFNQKCSKAFALSLAYRYHLDSTFNITLPLPRCSGVTSTLFTGNYERVVLFPCESLNLLGLLL